MGFHRGSFSLYFNRSSLRDFALGFDRYQEIEVIWDVPQVVADSLALNFLFFNVTLTYWREG